MGKPHSEMGFFGNVIHYDENGKKTGESWPGWTEEMVHYDAAGNKTGSSSPGLFGGVNHYDAHRNRTGTSWPGFTGETQHYDAHGNRTGTSYPGLSGTELHSSADAAPLGSYDYHHRMEGRPAASAPAPQPPGPAYEPQEKVYTGWSAVLRLLGRAIVLIAAVTLAALFLFAVLLPKS